ncbi:unnamed protein product [Brassica oleracea]
MFSIKVKTQRCTLPRLQVFKTPTRCSNICSQRTTLCNNIITQ